MDNAGRMMLVGQTGPMVTAMYVGGPADGRFERIAAIEDGGPPEVFEFQPGQLFVGGSDEPAEQPPVARYARQIPDPSDPLCDWWYVHTPTQ